MQICLVMPIPHHLENRMRIITNLRSPLSLANDFEESKPESPSRASKLQRMRRQGRSCSDFVPYKAELVANSVFAFSAIPAFR